MQAILLTGWVLMIVASLKGAEFMLRVTGEINQDTDDGQGGTPVP